jgi:glycosyltransferase involved in cell wall biosynthesis
LTDTPLHQSYFASLFQIPPDRICAVPVSTDERLFLHCNGDDPRRSAFPKRFEVFFYGSFLPLHGIDTILEAAGALSDKPVLFTLVGGGRGMGRRLNEIARIRNIGNIRHKLWVNYEDLPQWIKEADLCLGGPFGNTGQARRVITGKTFQFLAMGKPTVIGRIEGEFGFTDKDNCLLVPQGDGPSLAAAISWAMAHPESLASIGRRGRALYEMHYSIDRVRASLQEILANTLSAYGGER